MAVFWKPNALVCEGKDKNMSIGRVALWLSFIPAVHIWWNGGDIQIHHLYVLGFLLLYNFGKKIAPIAASVIESIKALKELL